jgi:hypothetical protein
MVGIILGYKKIIPVLQFVEIISDKLFNNVTMAIRSIMMDAVLYAKFNNAMKVAYVLVIMLLIIMDLVQLFVEIVKLLEINNVMMEIYKAMMVVQINVFCNPMDRILYGLTTPTPEDVEMVI